jgi:hypothetical protein
VGFLLLGPRHESNLNVRCDCCNAEFIICLHYGTIISGERIERNDPARYSTRTFLTLPMEMKQKKLKPCCLNPWFKTEREQRRVKREILSKIRLRLRMQSLDELRGLLANRID